MAARSGGDVLDMVWWYNFSPKVRDRGDSVPSKHIYTYEWRSPFQRPAADEKPEEQRLRVGQQVFVKPPMATCTSEWRRGVVTGTMRGVGVEVDGIRRHVADIREVPTATPTAPEAIPVTENDTQEASAPAEQPSLERPRRDVRLPRRFHDYVMTGP